VAREVDRRGRRLAPWTAGGARTGPFTLEHLDASSNVAQRDNAKRRLAEARTESPHGIINVGIFGEGTDSPTLSAVAFLEPRRSPIDVVQAVGRAMRTAEGKELGYVICPVLIPPNADPEQWLATAHPEEGWSELGQILLALRAHDDRIENELAELLRIYVPREHSSPPQTVTLVAAPRPSSGRIEYGVYRGTTESVYEILELPSPTARRCRATAWSRSARTTGPRRPNPPGS